MNYLIIGALVAGTLFAFTLTMVQLQPAKADPNPCIQDPKSCVLVPADWLKGKFPWPPPPDCPICGLINWAGILSLPDNQKFSVSVKHGPATDVVIIEIPKVLSGPLLQNMTAGNAPALNNMTMGK